MVDLRSVKVLLLGALAMVFVLAMPGFSTALLTSTSGNTATVRAAADWVPPTVSLVDPPLQVSGTQLLQARAADEYGTGVQSVTIEYRPAGGGSWTAVCTDSSAPYECSWKVNDLSNGNYELRARAIDRAGLVGSSQIATTNVAHGRLMLTHPGQPVRGVTELTAKMSSGWAAHTLQIEYREAGGRWKSVCSAVTRDLTCTWDTTRLEDGQYDLRVRAFWIFLTDEHIIYNVRVDNSSSRARAASLPAAPTQLGPRSGEGAPQRQPVDPPVKQEPRDEVAVEPTAAEPSTAPGAGETEAETQTQTTAPDHGAPTAPDEVIEEPVLRGVGIEVADGGTGSGSLDEGDTFTFTYTGEVDLHTVLPGWSGEATAVSVRLRDGALLGGDTQDDTLDIRSAGRPVELGQVHVGADVIGTEQQFVVPATMTVGTVTVDDGVLTSVTVALGAVVDEDEVLQPAGAAPVLTWTPSPAVTTLTGRACLAEPVGQAAGGSF